MVNIPTFKDIAVECDTTKPIPPLDDCYLDWPGKKEGRPKPPIWWIGESPRMLDYKGPYVYRINENISYDCGVTFV
jgi:hypothetical protein